MVGWRRIVVVPVVPQLCCVSVRLLARAWVLLLLLLLDDDLFPILPLLLGLVLLFVVDL